MTETTLVERSEFGVNEIVERFSDLCTPTELKIEYLLKRYAHLGAFYQQGVQAACPEDDTSPFGSPLMFEAYDAGVVIPAKSKAKKLIVSHIDLVPNFERGFSEGKTFVIEPYFDDVSVIKGALDNGITNAALCAILDKEGALPDDVEVLFSLGEESGSTGVEEYLRQKPESFFEDLFVINLDVSNEFFGSAAISIEFDYMDPVMCDEIKKCVQGVDFTTERFCDDTDTVLQFTDAAFSFCLPTSEYCHTYESHAILELLPAYCQGLRTLIFDFKIEYSAERADVYYLEQQKLTHPRFQGDSCLFRGPK